jgi:hypothetical protein
MYNLKKESGVLLRTTVANVENPKACQSRYAAHQASNVKVDRRNATVCRVCVSLVQFSIEFAIKSIACGRSSVLGTKEKEPTLTGQ